MNDELGAEFRIQNSESRRKTETALPFQFSIHHSSLIISLLLFSLFTSCNSHNSSKDKQADSSEINVAAAANLTDAFTEMGKEFTARTGIIVIFSFSTTVYIEYLIDP